MGSREKEGEVVGVKNAPATPNGDTFDLERRDGEKMRSCEKKGKMVGVTEAPTTPNGVTFDLELRDGEKMRSLEKESEMVGAIDVPTIPNGDTFDLELTDGEKRGSCEKKGEMVGVTEAPTTPNGVTFDLELRDGEKMRSLEKESEMVGAIDVPTIPNGDTFDLELTDGEKRGSCEKKVEMVGVTEAPTTPNGVTFDLELRDGEKMRSLEKESEMVGVTEAPTTHGDTFDLEKRDDAPPHRLKDLDDLYPYLGDFGWYQRALFLLMIPYAFYFAFVYFAQIFMTLVPEEHWCFVEELGNLTVKERRHLSIPQTNNHYDKCLVYDVNWTKVLQDGVVEPDTKWLTKKCDKNWEYNFTDVPYETIATQLNWVCERDNYAATAQSIFFCGAIFGGLIFGWIADKYGRIPALVGTNMCGFAAGVGTAFTNDFWSFCLCRFLVGLAYDNCFIIMYIIVLEYVGPKWRTFVANISIAVFFTFAACLLPWIALGFADWKTYTLVTSVPLVLSILTPWMVPESARWLISQGRIDEALKILKKCERVNKKKIPYAVLKEFRETATEIAKAEQETKNYSAADLFRSPRLRRHSILLLFIWICIAMVFDGHVRNVGSLGLDIFLTFTVATATEFPADILLTLTLDILGRRWLAFGSMVISGIFSILATTVPIGIPTASLAIVGRFAVNISYNIGMQYAAELLPTVVRAQGLALIHIMGYVATILVPYIVYMATIATYIPLLILGALGILGGCLCLFLPESMGKDMPQTILDGENYGREQRFWDLPWRNKKTKDVK